jgi:uncharacterized protein (DUF3084 family)
MLAIDKARDAELRSLLVQSQELCARSQDLCAQVQNLCAQSRALRAESRELCFISQATRARHELDWRTANPADLR